VTIAQTDTDVVALTPSSEETIYAPVGAGGAVVLLNLSDMSGTDEFILRHKVTFDVGGETVIGSKTILHGTTTDDTWTGTAGSAEAEGWTSWPLGFGNNGGTVTLESLSGSYDIEFVILDLGGPTG
jgi:CubicO group peptidase (beta-lactamase class C family)